MDPEQALIVLASTQDGVVSRAQAMTLGVTPDRWRSGVSGQFTPAIRGTAVLRAAIPEKGLTDRQRARSAVLAVGDPDAILCLGSALRVLGVAGTPAGDQEHLLANGGRHKRPGIVRHDFPFTVSRIQTIDGLRVTPILRSLLDAVRTYDRAHAVSVLDSALNRNKITLAHLELLAPHLGEVRRGWLALVDPKCESPLETRARLMFIDCGVEFESQVPEFVPNYGAVRLDFRLGEHLAVECDGKEAHDEPTAVYKDRARDDALRDNGTEVAHVTWADVEYHPDATMARIERARKRGNRAA